MEHQNHDSISSNTTLIVYEKGRCYHLILKQLRTYLEPTENF